MPSLKSVTNFINNNKNFTDQVDMNETEKYINSKRINLNDENIGFFFSIFVDCDDWIRMGTGAQNDHFRVCMSSIKLLKTCELVQPFGSSYCVDGTYKIKFEDFVLVVLGRTDMVRRLHPIAFMLTSHESTEDYEFFFILLLKMCVII